MPFTVDAVTRVKIGCHLVACVFGYAEQRNTMRRIRQSCFVSFLLVSTLSVQAADLQIAYFQADASPSIGSPLFYGKTIEVENPLSARGVVLHGQGQPIVLCAVDWIGIGNSGHSEWRKVLATAAGTTPDRVAVHALHQHDAPSCDFAAELVLSEHGLAGQQYDVHDARQILASVATAIEAAGQQLEPVTHVGVGAGEVQKVASNRRIIGPDGKIQYWRGSASKDEVIRAQPEGVIDPLVRSISFFNQEEPIVVLCYYATHPMSYYGTGKANPDFVGLARDSRERALNVPHVYFTGAGGNVAAGKYNDAAHENRQKFADRLAKGMAQAWDATEKVPVSADDLSWHTEEVVLPVATNLIEQDVLATLRDKNAKLNKRFEAARHLVWMRRCEAQDPVVLSCLHLGDARILHLCGELFVEYQLAAQEFQPDKFVALAAYGDYGPGYIGLEDSYPQGGYEVKQGVSRVAPEVEGVLMPAIGRLLAPGESR